MCTKRCTFPGAGMGLGADPTYGSVPGSRMLGMGLPKSAFPREGRVCPEPELLGVGEWFMK